MLSPIQRRASIARSTKIVVRVADRSHDVKLNDQGGYPMLKKLMLAGSVVAMLTSPGFAA